MTYKIEDTVIYAGKFKGYRLGDMTLTDLKDFAKTQVFDTMSVEIKNWVKSKSNRKHHTRDFWQDWVQQAGVEDLDDEIKLFTYEIKHFNPDSTTKGRPVEKSYRKRGFSGKREGSGNSVVGGQQDEVDWGKEEQSNYSC